MFRWARLTELNSDLFASFFHRNGCLYGVGDQRGEMWGYAWSFYHTYSYNNKHILCINSEVFPQYLRHVSSKSIIHTISNPLEQREGGFDTIYAFHCFHELNHREFLETSKHMYELLRPGGKLVLIEKYNINGQIEHDYMTFLDKIGFMLLRPYQYELIPLHERLNEEWFHQKDELILSHDNEGNKLAFFGTILFRPYSISELESKEFICNNSWKRKNSNNEIQLVEYIGGYQDDFKIYEGTQLRTFYLPDELISKESIGINELGIYIGTGKEESAMLINELICQEFLLEY